MLSLRAGLIWAALALVIAVPVALATTSPFIAWRPAVYTAAGFAGIAAMALLLIQPLLAAGLLPGLPARPGRKVHRWLGLILVGLILAHVGGLFLTSAPDVIDALLFDSPTPFSPWGVVAMWAIFATALLAALRERLRLGPVFWRLGHTALALVIVVGSVVHALLIEGTMEPWSKAALCVFALLATLKAMLDLRAWALLRRRIRPGRA
ncbi:ferric reductase-like transmembrane domain-containing protein [Rhabdaerophilum sp. SD176]|uniref:ferric reductase-like transmembrane domain-containing protein n=1 Tax=Rhabdaerophilum sp. SD176 TaxID=2983548 RepID=UPI0024DFF164|nr:ferric reductase-like transmembrane domain-containing protein [Rhabdaerophilum sp. SD176]